MLDTVTGRILGAVLRHKRTLKRLVPVRRPVLLHLPGFKIYVQLDDWVVGARIALRRHYEPHVVRAMQPFLPPGTTMVDIGANIGYHTLVAASRVGETGRVIAFEPILENCRLLRRSVAANGFAHVVVHQLAVADINGPVGFVMDDSNGAIEPGDASAGQCQVQAVRLDSFLAGEPRLHVVKMDIEGAEGRALRGMRALLARHRPVLFVEFSPVALRERSEMEPHEFLTELRSLGYHLRTIDRARDSGPAPETDAEIFARVEASGQGYVDLIALPAGP